MFRVCFLDMRIWEFNLRLKGGIYHQQYSRDLTMPNWIKLTHGPTEPVVRRFAKPTMAVQHISPGLQAGFSRQHNTLRDLFFSSEGYLFEVFPGVWCIEMHMYRCKYVYIYIYIIIFNYMSIYIYIYNYI